MRKFFSTYGAPILFFAVAIFMWDFLVKRLDIPEYILPAPSSIFSTFVSQGSRLFTHFFITLNEVGLGFLLGVIIGTLAGIGIVYSGFLKRIIYPLAIAIRVTPMVAIAPIIIIWFGFGLTSKMMVAMLITLFPIIVNTATGLLTVEPESIELMESMKATKIQIFFKLRFPNAMPTYFAGLKIAIGGAVIGAIIAELVAPTEGLGYLVLTAMSYLDTPFLFATISTLFIMGIGLFGLISLLEKFLVPWKFK